MTFSIGQTVWYLKDNVVHSAAIQARVFFETWKDSNLPPIFQGLVDFKSSEIYVTCHGCFPGYQLFASKKELLESL